jgi:hypothetical protein
MQERGSFRALFDRIYHTDEKLISEPQQLIKWLSKGNIPDIIYLI